MSAKFGAVTVEDADMYSEASEVERARICSIAACVGPVVIEVVEVSSWKGELVHTIEEGEIDAETEFESKVWEILAVDDECSRETDI